MRERLDEHAVDAFVARACDRHGGWTAFRDLDTLGLRFVDLHGAIPWLKGLGRTFPHPSAVDVSPRQKRATFLEYPTAGYVGVYDAGRVAISATSGTLATGSAHRPTFGTLAKWRRWTPLDAVYFFGYSLVDYLSLPFALAGRPAIDARRTSSGVELWYRFPPGADTHSTVQGFFFDDTGLLIRHDYRADILGRIFNGAHLHREHKYVDGILIATRRTVYMKPWHYPVRAMLPIPVLDARIIPRSGRDAW